VTHVVHLAYADGLLLLLGEGQGARARRSDVHRRGLSESSLRGIFGALADAAVSAPPVEPWRL